MPWPRAKKTQTCDPARPGAAPEMRAAGDLKEIQKKHGEALAAPSNGRGAKAAVDEKLAAKSGPPARPAKPSTADGKDNRPTIAKHYADGMPIVLPEEEYLERVPKVSGQVAATDPTSLRAKYKDAADGRTSLELAKAAQNDADALVVIVCDVSAEAAQKETFRHLLADNQIVWAEQSQDDEPDDKNVAIEDREKLADKSADGVAEGENRRIAARDQWLTEGLARAGAAELVEVRATRAQIDATLDRLAALPEQFLSVSIEAGAKAENRGRWNQYARQSGAVRKVDDPGVQPTEERLPPPAKGESLGDAELSSVDRAKRLEQPAKEIASPDLVAQRGVARRLSRLDALDESDVKAQLGQIDHYAAKLEAKPADDMGNSAGKGGGLALGRRTGGMGGGRPMEPGRGREVPLPAEQPAPADTAYRAPVAPRRPACPPAARTWRRNLRQPRRRPSRLPPGETPALLSTAWPMAKGSCNRAAAVPAVRLAQRVPSNRRPRRTSRATAAAGSIGPTRRTSRRKLAEMKKSAEEKEKSVAEKALERQSVQSGKTFDEPARRETRRLVAGDARSGPVATRPGQCRELRLRSERSGSPAAAGVDVPRAVRAPRGSHPGGRGQGCRVDAGSRFQGGGRRRARNAGRQVEVGGVYWRAPGVSPGMAFRTHHAPRDGTFRTRSGRVTSSPG